MPSRRFSARPSLRQPRLVRALLACLRLFALLMAAHMSGAGAVVVELGSAGEASDCCNDCPLGDDGKECPPGCPNCHCAHGSSILARAFESTLPATPDLVRELPAIDDATRGPRASAALGVYRPPRLDSLTSNAAMG
jgi:hypothetical protein